MAKRKSSSSLLQSRAKLSSMYEKSTQWNQAVARSNGGMSNSTFPVLQAPNRPLTVDLLEKTHTVKRPIFPNYLTSCNLITKPATQALEENLSRMCNVSRPTESTAFSEYKHSRGNPSHESTSLQASPPTNVSKRYFFPEIQWPRKHEKHPFSNDPSDALCRDGWRPQKKRRKPNPRKLLRSKAFGRELMGLGRTK